MSWLNRCHFGDCRTVLPTLPAGFADCAIIDPPYGSTSLAWDKRCPGWIEPVARALKPAASLWIFGDMRFLVSIFSELEAAGFRYGQDIVWEKQNGTGFHAGAGYAELSPATGLALYGIADDADSQAGALSYLQKYVAGLEEMGVVTAPLP